MTVVMRVMMTMMMMMMMSKTVMGEVAARILLLRYHSSHVL